MLTTRARSIVALLSLCSITVALAPGASAQPSDTQIGLRLVAQPLWHGPGDSLGLRLQIDNTSPEPLEGFLLRIEGHSRVSSRSALHESFDGDSGLSISSFSKYYDRREVAAGGSTTVTVRDPATELIALENAPGGGVFPVTVSLLDAGGTRLLDELVTPLIYYPSPPEIPLGVSLVIPLNDIPNRDPSGSFEVDPDLDAVRLESALRADGWLVSLLDAVDAATAPLPPPEPPERERDRKGKRKRERERPPPPPPLRLSLAPTPRFVEELADLTDGYSREGEPQRRDSPAARGAVDALRDLRGLLGRTNVQPLLVPYSFPDLPGIADRMSLEAGLIPQFSQAHDVLLEELGLEPRQDWVFPPAGRIDTGTLQDLTTIHDELEHVILTEESFQPTPDEELPTCPSGSPSFVCPVRIQGEGGMTALLTDTGLQERLADLVGGAETRLGVQNFFAETAMIREEAPGLTGRVVQVTVPSLWHPDASTIRLLLEGLREAPWLRSLTPDEALETGREPGPRRLVASVSGLAIEDPTEDLFQSIENTQALVESFRLVRPPSALTRRLSRNLLVAQSRLWGASALLTQRADDYVIATLDETRAELGKITVGGTDEIRLTSQRGEIPVEVFNDTDYKVTVNVRVVSPDLRLDESFPQVLPRGRFRQIPVDIAARSSGIFPVEVAVETPDGSYQIDTKSITVRSTEFNQVAVVITIGALAFLVLFFLVPRRRRHEPDAEPD